MPTIYRSFGLRANGLPIPTVRTVLTDRGPRWAALTAEMKQYYKEIAADAIDEFTNGVARRSLFEVPKGPREEHHWGEHEEGSLAASIRYPGNDNFMRCNPVDDYFTASIQYDAPYAVAQHEGAALMMHHHPIIPGDEGFFEKTNLEKEVLIEWRVENYTTPGTKSHYLSDPFKAELPFFEEEVGRYVRARLWQD